MKNWIVILGLVLVCCAAAFLGIAVFAEGQQATPIVDSEDRGIINQVDELMSRRIHVEQRLSTATC